ncbi:MAG: hypothetical protein ABI868_13470 [Acidobacteriota bacterium]
MLIALFGDAAAAPPAAMLQPARDGGCAEWRACRELALAAAERSDYATFHDLAWRAIQTGPAKDPALMYMLARAQALSGRPHDALVMLQRLADMGVASDAATNDDFNRVRELPGWPDVEARIAGAATGAVSAPSPPVPSVVPRVRTPAAAAASPPSAAPPAPLPAPPSAPLPAPPPARSLRPAPAAGAPSPPTAPSPPLAAPSPPAASPSAAVVATLPATPGVRFSTRQFAVSGLAYDAPSRRFVLGDRLGRKLIVVDESSSHAIDLVRADSAGFLDIAAVEIDARRGDLWVASSAPADGAGTLHRLQLVSGRPLRAFSVGGDLGPVTLVDLAVEPGGAILVLDSRTPQLLVLRTGGTALERVARLDAPDASSVAVRGDEAMAFVAHRDGVSRIDLRSRSVSRLTAPAGVSLGGLERIRWRRNALIGVQVEADGSRRVIRFDLNARGSAVTQAGRLEIPPPTAGQTFVTVSGDELLYLKAGVSDADGGAPATPADASDSDFVAYRAQLP